MDPLDILPPELWRMIFEKVEEDPQDWLNLYRASSSSFEVLVREERTRVLLTQVFPLVRKHLELEDEDGGTDELLPLRLVSRRWKKAVDATLGPPEVPFGDENGNNFDFEDRSQIGKKYKFGGPIKTSSFLETFATHPGNPFVGNFVQFWFPLNVGKETLLERGHLIQRLMRRFGNQISTLSVRGSRIRNPSLDTFFIDQIQSCVQLAPNLESLAVRFDGSDGLDYRLVLDDNPNVETQTFPLIPKLKSFAFSGNGKPDFLVSLQNLLVRLCCNPDTLKMVEMVGVPMELTTFPNLEIAQVDIIAHRVEDIPNLLSSSWPLTRLTLSAPGASPSIVVECVEHFKNTLTSLWIYRGIAGGSQRNNMELSPDLPRLKFLIVHHHYLSVRRFFSNLPNLEKLRIFNWVCNKYHAKQWFGDMEAQLFSELKIWNILPKLREIEMVGWYMIANNSNAQKSVCKVCYR